MINKISQGKANSKTENCSTPTKDIGRSVKEREKAEDEEEEEQAEEVEEVKVNEEERLLDFFSQG